MLLKVSRPDSQLNCHQVLEYVADLNCEPHPLFLLNFLSHQFKFNLAMKMAGRWQAFQNNPELQRSVLHEVRTTGRQLGMGSYGRAGGERSSVRR